MTGVTLTLGVVALLALSLAVLAAGLRLERAFTEDSHRWDELENKETSR